jgi:hypothetical protein
MPIPLEMKAPRFAERPEHRHTWGKTSTGSSGGTLPGGEIVSKAASPGLLREAVPTLSSPVGRRPTGSVIVGNDVVDRAGGPPSPSIGPLVMSSMRGGADEGLYAKKQLNKSAALVSVLHMMIIILYNIHLQFNKNKKITTAAVMISPKYSHNMIVIITIINITYHACFYLLTWFSALKKPVIYNT